MQKTFQSWLKTEIEGYVKVDVRKDLDQNFKRAQLIHSSIHVYIGLVFYTILKNISLIFHQAALSC